MNDQNPVISSQDLFDDSQMEGILSPSSATVLSDLSNRIDKSMQQLSVTPTITTQTLVAMLLDNSPSMNYCANPGAKDAQSNYQSVVAGHNLVIESLKGAKAVNSIEALTQLLNPEARYINTVTGGDKDFKWLPLSAAHNLIEDEYIQGWSTPLYDRSLELLGSVIARTKWWEDEYGVQTTSRCLILSDGENTDGRYTASDVKQVVEDMLAMEKHRIFFLGVRGPDSSVDFHDIATQMGIPHDSVGVVPSDPKAIRAWFQLFSQSATADVSDPVKVSDVNF